MLILVAGGLFERFFVLLAPFSSFTLVLLALHLGKYACCLLAAHHGNTRIGPHEQQIGVVGSATHAVVASTEAAANQHGVLRYVGAGYGGDQLGAVLGDAFVLVFGAHHKAGDVLQEHQRDFALGAQLNKVRTFYCAL